jgi:hypothetical protein
MRSRGFARTLGTRLFRPAENGSTWIHNAFQKISRALRGSSSFIEQSFQVDQYLPFAGLSSGCDGSLPACEVAASFCEATRCSSQLLCPFSVVVLLCFDVVCCSVSDLAIHGCIFLAALVETQRSSRASACREVVEGSRVASAKIDGSVAASCEEPPVAHTQLISWRFQNEFFQRLPYPRMPSWHSQ